MVEYLRRFKYGLSCALIIALFLIIFTPTVFSSPSDDIRITLHDKELHDDSSKSDDYTKSTFSGAGYTDASVNALNSSAVLRFDENADGDLKDYGDYDLFNHLVIIDRVSGDIQFAYKWSEHPTYSNGDGAINAGDVIEIKGDKYVVTDNKTSDGNIQLGPAITKTLSGSTVDPNNAVVVSGTKKLLYSNEGRLYFYDGTSLLETVDLTGVSDYPYMMTADDVTTDEFKIYKIYVVAETKNVLARITMVEKSQEVKLSNDEEGIFGYSRIKIDDSDWFSGGKTGVYFLSDPISLVKGSTIDLPDTYYSLKYTITKQFDILRKKTSTVASGTKLKDSVEPGSDFLLSGASIIVTVVGPDISIYFGSDELHDDSSPADDYTKSTFSSAGYSNASVVALNSSAILRFDENADGDLKDSDDYDLYNHLVIINSASGDIQFAYNWSEHSTYSNLDGAINAGDVITIKGDNYVVTDNKTSDSNIELGPAITKTLTGSTVDKDNAVVVAGTKKVLYSNEGKLYFYDGTSLLEVVDLTGVTDYPYKLTADDITTDEFRMYKIYVVAETKNVLARITMVEKSQEVKLTNDEEGVFGYSSIKIDDFDWFDGGRTGVFFLSDPIALVKGMTLPLPDTYYSLKYTSAKQFDILRKKTYIVPSGTKLTSYTEPGEDFLYQSIILSVVGSDISIDFSSNELHDDSTSADDYTKSTFTNAGYSDASVNALNSSAVLRFDENADDDLRDSDDYDLYNHIVIIDDSNGDIQFAYKWTEHSIYSNGDGNINAGEVITIKGDKYVITDNKTSDLNIELGPAITKKLTADTVDKDNAVIVSGTKAILYGNDGGLYFYDEGSIVDGPVSLSGISSYPYKLTTSDITSDEFKIYKIYVISADGSTAKVAMVEKSQEVKLTNNEEGVFGYNQIKIADPDWFVAGGKSGVYFLSDPISLVKGETIDLADTYYSLKYTFSKEFDIKRKKVSAVASGTKLKTSTDPGFDFLKEEIKVFVIPPTETVITIDEVIQIANKLELYELENGSCIKLHILEVELGKGIFSICKDDGQINVTTGSLTSKGYPDLVIKIRPNAFYDILNSENPFYTTKVQFYDNNNIAVYGSDGVTPVWGTSPFSILNLINKGFKRIYENIINVEFFAESTFKSVNKKAIYNLTLTNHQNISDTFTLTVSNISDANYANLSLETTSLGQNSSSNFTLEVSDETEGKYIVATHATSQNDKRIVDVVYTTTKITPLPTDVSFSISSYTKRAGSNLTLPVTMNTTTTVGSIQLNVLYDSTVIKATNVTQGNASFGALFAYSINDSIGKITIGVVDSSGLNTNGSIADITFNVTAEGGNFTSLTLVNEGATDTTSNNLSVGLSHGNLTVFYRLKGDADDNGIITAADSLLYLRYAVGQDIFPYHLDSADDDVTCDGIITSSDALKVLRKAVGQDVDLETC